MSNRKLFPHYKLLQKLVDGGSLNQSQNLSTAMRRWGFLKWLTGDAGQTAFSEAEGRLSFPALCQAFFDQEHAQGKSLEKMEFILLPHNLQCHCHKITEDWLIFYGFTIAEWQQNLQQECMISQQTFDQVLKERQGERILFPNKN